MALPASVRAMVDNDPGRLLQALTDPEETAALAEAGLPMVEGWEPVSSQEQKAEPPASEGNQAESSGAIKGGE